MNKKLIRLTENDLHNIINESINSVIAENNYQNIFKKLKAALAIARRKGEEKSANEIENKLAMFAAINDINRELKDEKINPKGISYIKRISKENGGYIPDLERAQKFEDYMNAGKDFNTTINPNSFKDAKGWLNNRNNNIYDE